MAFLRRGPAGKRQFAAWLAVPALVAACAAPGAANIDGSLAGDHEGQPLWRYTFSGHRVTRDYVIARELRMSAGQPYRSGALAADLSRLENLGIFSSILPVFSQGDSGLVLDLVVKEMPSLIPYPALTFNEVDGWSAGAGVVSVNLFGRAISLSGRVLPVGTTQGNVALVYPWIGGNHRSFAASYTRLDRLDELNEFRERSHEVSASFGTYLGRNGRLSASAGYLRMGSDVDGKTLSPDNVDDLLSFGGACGYDSRDSYRRPTRGWLHGLQVTRTGGPLPGDGDFWTGSLDLRGYQRVRRTHVLSAGALLSLQSGALGVELPEYLQYHLGGANSIRGHDPIELGRVLYGKNQYILTVEYGVPVRRIREYRIFKWTFSLGLDVAAFADHGCAFSTSHEVSLARSRSGVGVGVRLLVPSIEQLRVDFALGEGGEFQVHFAAGGKLAAQVGRLR